MVVKRFLSPLTHFLKLHIVIPHISSLTVKLSGYMCPGMAQSLCHFDTSSFKLHPSDSILIICVQFILQTSSFFHDSGSEDETDFLLSAQP